MGTPCRFKAKLIPIQSVSNPLIRSDTSDENLNASTFSNSMNSPWLLLVASSVMLLSATFNTIATKLTNRQKIPRCNDCPKMYFEAPMFQTLIGFVGEFSLLPIYYIYKVISKKYRKIWKFESMMKTEDLNKPHCPIWLWIVPLLFDFTSSLLLNYSIMLSQASTVILLRNISILFAFLLSAFLLKNKIYLHQVLGIIIIFTGLILVSIYAIVTPDLETNHNDLQWLGIITALIGTLLSTFQWVSEEAIFRKYYCSPLEGVGWMGLYGTFLGIITVVICHFLGWEDFKAIWYQLTSIQYRESRIVVGVSIGYIFSAAIFCASGITITKLASSLLRTIINAGRTISIWLVEIILKWTHFSALNFFGLILILLAICFYNYNYIIKKENTWFGDRYLRLPASCLPNKYEVTLNSQKIGTRSTTQLNNSSKPTACHNLPTSDKSTTESEFISQ